MPCSTPYGRCMCTSCKRQNKLMPPEKGVDKGPQPLIFNPALTTQGELPRWGKRRPPGGCASERMKTQRFSYFAGFAARRPAAAGQFRPVSRGGTSCFLREAKPVKLEKVAFSHFFDWFGFIGGKTPHTPGCPCHCQCNRSERRGRSRNSRTRRSFRRPWRICGICHRRWRSIPWRTAPRRFH